MAGKPASRRSDGRMNINRPGKQVSPSVADAGASNSKTPNKILRDPVKRAVEAARTARAGSTFVHPGAMTSLEYKKPSRRPEKFISAYPVYPNPPAQAPLNAGVSGYGSTNSVQSMTQTTAPAVSSGGTPTNPQE